MQAGEIQWEVLFERVLRAIAFCADAKISALDADRVNGSGPASRAPTLSGVDREDPHPLYDLPKRWRLAATPAAQREVCAAAVKTLRDIRYAPQLDPALMRGTKEWRERVARDARGSRTVAALYELDWRTVLKYRREFGVTGTSVR